MAAFHIARTADTDTAIALQSTVVRMHIVPTANAIQCQRTGHKVKFFLCAPYRWVVD